MNKIDIDDDALRTLKEIQTIMRGENKDHKINYSTAIRYLKSHLKQL